MPPPNPPRNHRGQLVNAKGQTIDAHGRRLDGFDRPMERRILEDTEDVQFPGFPSLIIAYPSFNDWTAMFDPRDNRGAAANSETYEDFKEKHQKQITSMLKEITARKAGQALLGETNRSPHWITILPIDFVSTQSRWVKFHNNAIASPHSAKESAVKGSHAGQNKDGDNLKGTGAGTSSWVYFTPERIRPGGGPGYNPDEILFHELVHAVRDMQGASTAGFKMGNAYDNAEEFAAVVTTNVYMSEKKQTDLRANHGRGKLENPDRFLDHPQVPSPGARGLLSVYRRNQPRLFAALANIDSKTAAFNPFRDLNEESIAASEAHDAKMREFDRRNR